MEINLLIKIAGIGFLVASCSQILNKYGRDEQSMLVVVSGIVIVLLMLLGEMSTLINTLRTIFGL
ncbi:MAG: stage III sporulation protein AC [Ruminococcaceae bacterium]|nr:stage III sporulation protein AC [Oscillospiraceae bacterium]MBO4971791.1 stage III sporulation protein AC [Clostridia bacterium]MBQ1259161.1 stage III sporulation protein AC [Clostridia bacterium]